MLLLQETWLNRTEHYIIDSTDVYKTAFDDKGELFRHLQKEYGRCISRVYTETPGEPQPIGWVFLKRQRYDGSNDTYLLETWCTLHRKPPTVTVQYHYLGLEDTYEVLRSQRCS